MSLPASSGRHARRSEEARLVVPARVGSIGLVQHLARWFAQAAGFPPERRYRVELSVEELITTLLVYAFDGGVEEGDLIVDMHIDAAALHLVVTSHGLPFDLSMVPDFDPALAGVAEDTIEAAGLSAFLLKHAVDRYRLVNAGKEGYRVELEWFLPHRHVTEIDDAGEYIGTELVPPPVDILRAMDENEALQLARLLYRSYGYSYVNEDFYYPERIRARLGDGRLRSWVAVTGEGRLVGHVALMRGRADDPAVEWGVAAVDPLWRGGGLLKRLLAAALDDVQVREAQVVFAHAVTTHPYTQRACLDFGFSVTALLLGFAPALQFRQISDASVRRESTFIALRACRPLPVQVVYLPARHAATLHRLAQAAGMILTEAGSRPLAPVTGLTRFASQIISALNVATLDIQSIGADHVEALSRECRRLCRERVDVIYLSVDLADPQAPTLIEAAESEGFFLAGFTPWMPKPHSLTLQYLNNLEIDFASLQSAGELAQWLKQRVMDEWCRVEQG
ncbi:MAG: ATP-binding protein [Halothiobacillaceae bacterium]|nr:ATP-binding protein [Halothiobacillaceae bacterium]